MRLPALLSTLAALSCGGASLETPALSTVGAGLYDDASYWELCGPSARLVQNIAPGARGADPEALASGPGFLFFAADDGASGREPWVSTGAGAGTWRVKDLAPGAASSDPALFTRLGNTVFFTADNGLDGHELWKSDGTKPGTVQLGDLQPGSAGSEPEHLTAFKGVLYFTADDGVSGRELWRSDGTVQGTYMVRDFTPGRDYLSTGFALAATSRHLYIRVSVYSPTEVEGNRTQLWRTDGTARGFVLLFDASEATTVLELTPFGDRLFFLANFDEPSTRLYLTDGTFWGTRFVQEFLHDPRELTVFDGKLYFAAGTQANTLGVLDEELWRSDGTRAGTVRVMDLSPGLKASEPSGLTVVGGTLFFSADDGEHGRELWQSDGTPTGTMMSEDLEPGLAGSAPEELTAIDGHLFFSASTSAAGREAWVKGAGLGGAVPLSEASPGAASSEPREFVRSGWDIYFSAADRVAGRELRAVRFRPEGQCDPVTSSGAE